MPILSKRITLAAATGLVFLREIKTPKNEKTRLIAYAISYVPNANLDGSLIRVGIHSPALGAELNKVNLDDAEETPITLGPHFLEKDSLSVGLSTPIADTVFELWGANENADPVDIFIIMEFA
jgi:hypothetical protein